MTPALKLCPFCGNAPETIDLNDELMAAIQCYHCDITLCASAVGDLVKTWNERPLDKVIDAALLETKDKLHNYGSALASVYSLAKPLEATNGVCAAIAEFIEEHAPLAAERKIA